MSDNFSFTRRDFLKLTGIFSASLSGFTVTPSINNLLEEYRSQPDQDTASMEKDRVANIIARGLYDSGVSVITSVPASKCSEIFQIFCKTGGYNPLYSFNEEAAYTIAHGAAITGQRAAMVIKAHGIAKAANSVVDSLTAGTTGGFLVRVCNPVRKKVLSSYQLFFLLSLR